MKTRTNLKAGTNDSEFFTANGSAKPYTLKSSSPYSTPDYTPANQTL